MSPRVYIVASVKYAIRSQPDNPPKPGRGYDYGAPFDKWLKALPVDLQKEFEACDSHEQADLLLDKALAL